VYLPPSSLADLPALQEALQRFRVSKTTPIVLGDFNVDLSNLSTPRAIEVAATLAAFGLEDMLPHFYQRGAFGHLKTYWQRRTGKPTIRSRCDYILATDRRLFHTIALLHPRHFSSDHYMVLASFLTQTDRHKN
jgi:endonuclease/exonuclease/phosphatase family metal-dependent hydrolase